MRKSHVAMDSVLQGVVDGYLECAAWADAPEGSTARFPAKEQEGAAKECAEFVRACGPLFAQAIQQVGYSPERFGHDFWLSSCGHGANYKDRDELRVPVEGPCPSGMDRNGKAYALSGQLHEALFQVAYGTSGAISRFAYPSLIQEHGYLYIC